MSDSYSFSSKNFVLFECKGTKKNRNRGIVDFRKILNHINNSFTFQQKKEQIVRTMGNQQSV